MIACLCGRSSFSSFSKVRSSIAYTYDGESPWYIISKYHSGLYPTISTVFTGSSSPIMSFWMPVSLLALTKARSLIVWCAADYKFQHYKSSLLSCDFMTTMRSSAAAILIEILKSSVVYDQVFNLHLNRFWQDDQTELLRYKVGSFV